MTEPTAFRKASAQVAQVFGTHRFIADGSRRAAGTDIVAARRRRTSTSSRPMRFVGADTIDTSTTMQWQRAEPPDAGAGTFAACVRCAVHDFSTPRPRPSNHGVHVTRGLSLRSALSRRHPPGSETAQRRPGPRPRPPCPLEGRMLGRRPGRASERPQRSTTASEIPIALITLTTRSATPAVSFEVTDPVDRGRVLRRICVDRAP